MTHSHHDSFGMRMRIFWADLQRVFLLPLLLIFAVYFFVRLNSLDRLVMEHHAMPGHVEAVKIATEAKTRADELDSRVERLERLVNHVFTNPIPKVGK